jgi:alpha-2-macroglobulin
MKTIILSVAVFAFLLFNAAAQQSDYVQLRATAEKEYSQRSYARAHEIYASVDKSKLTASELRWVEFRLADTSWRSQASTETPDTTKFDEAQKQLQELIRAADKDVDRDLVWAEAHESLGDFFWTRGQMNWSAAWPHYEQALDWWAGQRDLERARLRYLTIIFRAAYPPNPNEYYVYTYYGNNIPLNILENALKISSTDNDRSHLNYLIAMTMRYTGASHIGTRQRIPDYFEDALKAGRQSAWYDDALFHYADWMANSGPMREVAGQWRQQPDYVKALELYRRLVSEFAKGQTRYFDQASQQILAITTPSVSIGVGNVFLPESELQFHLNARNVPRINFALYKIDMTRDIPSGSADDGDEGVGEPGHWIGRISSGGKQLVKTWTKTIDTADYKLVSEQSRVEGKLPMGAYLLEATSDSNTPPARDLLLVSDATLVLKSSGKQALVFFCNALTSAPIPNANITLWESYYNTSWRWRRVRKTTNADGVAQFPLSEIAGSRTLFATAAGAERQAFATGHSYRQPDSQDWRIYAFTDRPAYRPKEKMQWKFIARRSGNGIYSTPANSVIEYQINDPRGAKVSEGKATLNAFGSAWGSLELGEQFMLGQYQVQFWDESRAHHIGSATLFRLEEYKLPEFKVEVKTPEQDGKKKAFRLGERVEVDIQADYYFGGPVSNASVEVVVYQNAFYHYWFPRREYAWYYEDFERQHRIYGGGRGQVVKRETLRTDSTGKARLSFETPRENYNQDFEFQIEARVVDSSRREILATDNVRVTRQRYYVYPRPERNIYRPQDKVTVDVKAIDANQQPVQTEGAVKITRDYWWEIWIDSRGREVQGDELRRLQRSGVFPPQTTLGQDWKLKFRGYQHEDILTTTVKTDAEGVAKLNFTPAREGYYRVAWQSNQGVDTVRDRFLPPIKAETYVFVATNATTDLGYQRSGLEIVVDKDTFRVGQTAPVMISVPTSDRYVLFSVEAEDLFSYQVVHVAGTAKLIEVPIEVKHVPNIFLSAIMAADAAPFADTKQVIVPPVEQFLAVNVKPDREQYQPREEGTLIIDAKDVNGRPVSAEIALGLIDESVKYIQQDYAGDPRQFYYGRKRGNSVLTTSTFHQKRYGRFTEVDGQLRDEREVAAARRNAYSLGGSVAGVDTITFSGRNAYVAGQLQNAADGISEAVFVTSSESPRPAKAYDEMVQVSAKERSGFVQQVEPAVQVRTDFRSTILWLPDVKTDADGTATVKVKYPDSLTTWSATARAATTGSQFGFGNSSTRTKQPLIVRLQAPRFFVVGDQVTVSAVINNNTDEPMRVSPALTADGLTLQQANPKQPAVEVKANSEMRVDWQVVVTHASEAKLKVEARGAKYADAMEKTFTIFEHGIEKFVSRSGKMRGDSVSIKLDIPKERRGDSTAMTVQVAPSMATTMLDALPYLIEYPYGCTEQTMSRFLPAVITAKTLRDLGLKPETAMNKVFGGIEPETAAATHTNARRDLRELERITKAGLERLYEFQQTDGGWGWWKEGGSDHFMTAYVIWGMTLARQAGVDVKSESIERAAAYLVKELVEEENSYDAQAWMLHALAVYHAAQKRSEVGKFQTTAFSNLWNNREKLNAYTRALLALAAHSYGYTTQAQTLVQNLENGVKIDSRPDTSIVQRGAQSSDPSVIGTAHWGQDGIYWRWSDGGVESTSFALRALLAIDPKNKLIEPVTNWLVKNRRGAQWSNTRDTAIVVLTLNDYLRTSGELQPAVGYQVLVNGSPVATRQLTVDEALSAPTRFAVPRELIRDGLNEISIVRKNGSGPLYFSAEAEFFSLEEPLKPAGNEIFVRRQYFKLVNHPTLLKGIVSERVPLNDGETVKSGERVEVVLTVEAKNNYEYLLFEDLKPAGLEAVQVRSGGNIYIRELKSGALTDKNATLMNFTSKDDFTGRSRWVYQELRDRKVALFVDRLPEGVWQLSYELRAEAPGAFHALPVLGHAMYVPEIRTNGAEARIRVVD